MSRVAILLLGDSPPDAERVGKALARDGIEADVERVATRGEFRDALKRRRYGLVLADYALSDFNGPSALDEALRLAPGVPFIFLSDTPGEEVAIEALKHGATDYVIKQRFQRLAPAVRRALAEARARKGLRESEEMFRLIVENARDYAIFTLDLGRRVTSWNPGAQRLLGFEEAEVLGKDGDIVFTPEDRDRDAGRLEMETALAAGRAADDRWHLRKDGSRFWASGLMTPLRDDAGAVRGFLKILRDMTEPKRLEDTLRAANRRKDDFLAVLAHELRNPLAPVRNALHLLRFRSEDPATVEQMRSLMERQIGHLSRLIEDLLEVSRLTRGKIVLRRERLDLTRQVRLAVEDRRATLEQAGLDLQVDVPETPVWVSADGTRLAQVLDNLLENAVKFTPRGGRVVVRVEDHPITGQAVLHVRDNGVGIEPEVLARLFEPLSQADASLERTGGGLGLGLALVKGLVELHGGRVWAASAGVDRGAEFTVSLPQEPEPMALTPKPVRPKPARQRLRVLVVEDSRDAAATLRDLLTMFGYDVTVAHTGTEGLEVARKSRPDVVLCDIGLPGLDGFAVARALRNDPDTAATRLIAVTGYGQEADRRRALAAGFHEHLTKPVDPEALLEQIEARERNGT